MRFQRLAAKPMMRPKVRQHQQMIALQFAAKPLHRRMLLDDPCNTDLEHGLQRTVLSPTATAQVTERIEQTTGRQRGEHHFQAFQVVVFIQRVAVADVKAIFKKITTLSMETTVQQRNILKPSHRGS